MASQLASSHQPQRSHLERQTLRDNNQEDAKSRLPKFTKSYAQEVVEHRRTASQRLEMQWAEVVVHQQVALDFQDPEPPHIHHESTKLIVGELYPRLLYTFSDVVCFITNNVKFVHTTRVHDVLPRLTSQIELLSQISWICFSGHQAATNER